MSERFPPEASGPTPPPMRPRILCVDDEPLSLESLTVALRRHYEVVSAASGEEGLVALRAGGFHAIVSDYDMPGMNGARFLRAAREIAPDTVRMLLSGRAGFAEAMQVINDGYIFRFLTKPCPPDTMLQALDDAVEHHRLRTADRTLLERRVAEVSSQLLRAERLATLGNLATGVGHEMANLTTVFLGVVGAIRESFQAKQLPDEQDLKELERLGEHLRQHSKHLLNLGRPRADTIKVIDLGTVVRESLELLKVVGKIKRLEVTLDAPEESLPVKASRMQLEQVMLNLIGNAADALESVRGRPGRISVRLWRAGPAQIGCSIGDNGCGIPQDKLAAIFEPYFTTKPPGKGTGLGLPVVKQIIEGYGSQIQVESELDRGTTFSFFFALADEAEDLGPSLAPPARPAPATRKAS